MVGVQEARSVAFPTYCLYTYIQGLINVFFFLPIRMQQKYLE